MKLVRRNKLPGGHFRRRYQTVLWEAFAATRPSSQITLNRFVPLSQQNLHTLLLSGNKRDRIETLTQCAEWSQFVVHYFFQQSDVFRWEF